MTHQTNEDRSWPFKFLLRQAVDGWAAIYTNVIGHLDSPKKVKSLFFNLLELLGEAQN